MEFPAQPTEGEYFFDIERGQLLAGKVAVDAALEDGAERAAIHPLAVLLTHPERIVGPKKFKPIKYDEWDSADDIPKMQWLDEVVKQYDPNKVLTKEVAIRAGYIGLIPRLNYYRTRDGGFSSLYDEANLTGTRTNGYFDDWPTKKFADHILNIANVVGHKPTAGDIDTAAKNPGNPSYKLMLRRFGSLDILYELNGFVHTSTMTREDKINWGVRFMEANDGKLPTKVTMSALSKKGFAFGLTTIYRREDFKSFLDFQTECMFAYEEKRQFNKELREAHHADIKKLKEQDPLFKKFASEAKGDDQLMQVYARYKLFKRVLPDKNLASKQSYALSTPKTDSIIKVIRKLDDTKSVADIEMEAEAMQLSDILWPMDSHLETLKVA